MDGILTPAVILKIVEYGKDGGLALALIICMIWLAIEIRRHTAKDKIIAEKDKINLELQQKMLELYGETKIAVSNGNLLLEMLTRGRR